MTAPLHPQIMDRIARTLARIHTRTFLLDAWAHTMDESGIDCPYALTWGEWARAAKDGSWPDLTKMPWEQ